MSWNRNSDPPDRKIKRLPLGQSPYLRENVVNLLGSNPESRLGGALYNRLSPTNKGAKNTGAASNEAISNGLGTNAPNTETARILEARRLAAEKARAAQQPAKKSDTGGQGNTVPRTLLGRTLAKTNAGRSGNTIGTPGTQTVRAPKPQSGSNQPHSNQARSPQKAPSQPQNPARPVSQTAKSVGVETQLRALMQDPRYWKPGQTDDAYRDGVTRLFEAAWPGLVEMDESGRPQQDVPPAIDTTQLTRLAQILLRLNPDAPNPVTPANDSLRPGERKGEAGETGTAQPHAALQPDRRASTRRPYPSWITTPKERELHDLFTGRLPSPSPPGGPATILLANTASEEEEEAPPETRTGGTQPGDTPDFGIGHNSAAVEVGDVRNSEWTHDPTVEIPLVRSQDGSFWINGIEIIPGINDLGFQYPESNSSAPNLSIAQKIRTEVNSILQGVLGPAYEPLTQMLELVSPASDAQTMRQGANVMQDGITSLDPEKIGGGFALYLSGLISGVDPTGATELGKLFGKAAVGAILGTSSSAGRSLLSLPKGNLNRYGVQFNANGYWASPAGVIYGPGTAQGNRVAHVMEHLTPNPNKPNHTVFNVERADLLRLLDEAWIRRRAGKPGRFPGTEVFVVPMGRSVGTAGEANIVIVVRPGTSEILTAFPRS